MARKQQGTDWGTLLVMAIIFGASVLLAILLFLLRVSALLLLFAFPLLLLWAYIPSRNSAVPIPREAPSEEMNAKELRKKMELESCHATYEDRRDQGIREGFEFTSASEGKWFDRRSLRARQLNRQLDELEKKGSTLEKEIEDFSKVRSTNVADFEAALKHWSLQISLRKTANLASIVTIFASIVFVAARQANVPILIFADDLLARLQFPLYLILPFKAVAMGYVAAAISYPISKFILVKQGTLAVENYEQLLPTNELPLDFEPTFTTFEGDPDDDFEDVLDEDEEADVEPDDAQEQPNTEAPIDDSRYNERYDLEEVITASPTKAKTGYVLTVKCPNGQTQTISISHKTEDGARFCFRGMSRIRRPDGRMGNFWVQVNIPKRSKADVEDF
jgi:hypothetical protein